ncbi:hypothetical protein ES703_69208 [subsurface metagenome]
MQRLLEIAQKWLSTQIRKVANSRELHPRRRGDEFTPVKAGAINRKMGTQ